MHYASRTQLYIACSRTCCTTPVWINLYIDGGEQARAGRTEGRGPDVRGMAVCHVVRGLPLNNDAGVVCLTMFMAYLDADGMDPPLTIVRWLHLYYEASGVVTHWMAMGKEQAWAVGDRDEGWR